MVIDERIFMSDRSSTSLDKSERVVAAKRVTFTSSRPYNQAVSSLNFELNASKAGVNLLRLLATATTRKELVNGINEMADGRDFILFNASSYNWLNVYFGDEQKFARTTTYTLGNPLLGKDMLRHDPDAALYIPPKILIQETGAGGTRIVYDLPSSVIGQGIRSAELASALAELDTKLELLVKRVLGVTARL